MEDKVIALFEFELLEGQVRKVNERHYKLVLPDELTQEDLARYRQRFDASGSA